MKFFINPKTKEPDPMLTLTFYAVAAVAIKFLFEGVEIGIAGHTLSLGHADYLTYGAVLTPVLGAHSFIHGRKDVMKEPHRRNKVDNPDES